MSTIAFIPVRGGSKSIPLKNIKLFCGRPLVYWTVKAAADIHEIDEVVVATDSGRIKEVVNSFSIPKVSIYDRDPCNAQDTSSTESVMLEYISKSNLKSDDVFILVQATSPLLTANDLENGLAVYHSEFSPDSVLSCVRTKRFYWLADGKSLNYDYRNRPRRQDFNGIFMENGAFYINTVGNILRDKNRLSGRIAIAEMPEYTSFEIDEPDDWHIMEMLMRRHILKKTQRKIKLVLTDVDGVLTDGGMYYSENGDELKKFNTRDGMGFQLLREAGIKTGIITSENTRLVERRAQKIKADFLVQGKREGGKLAAAQEICSQLGILLSEVAYIGDDINCKELLENVGLAACPSDATSDVRNISFINILKQKGGNGVFREFVDIIVMGENF